MRIRTKDVRDIAGMIDEIIDDYKEKSEESTRDWRTYEQLFPRRYLYRGFIL